MKALTLYGPRDLRLSTVPDPAIAAPTDAIVRVTLAGVCGSDLHPYHGRETGFDPGCVTGHEFVGEVVDVGADVRLRTGTVVVSPFTTSCGACFYCRRGLTCRCTSGELFGWVAGGVGLHGAQAEYVRVPLADTTLVAVGDLPHEAALLAGDVLATGSFCAEAAGVESNDTVAVVGCGPVGLMAILGARERNAGRVFALDRVPERLALAERFGATPVDVGGDPIGAIRAATDGRGADRVLEAVGSPGATRLAYDAVRPGGSIAAAGVHTEPHLGFSPGEAYDKNITYVAGRCPARRFIEPLFDVIRSGRYDLTAVISHRMPLDDGVHAYALFDEKRDGCTKVVLRA